MSEANQPPKEGGVDAPKRHALDWKKRSFYDESQLTAELTRVFDICHSCRRCFSLCQAFPTLFDAIDESETGELDSVDRKVYWDVAQHCYLCDLCYMTKCPYVPPHPFNVDFPHLMLRAKAVHFEKHGARRRDRLLSDTDTVGRFAGIPIVAETINAASNNTVARRALEKVGGVHRDAVLPPFSGGDIRKKLPAVDNPEPVPTAGTRGRVAVFLTCYGSRNAPEIVEDLFKVFSHNGIEVRPTVQERCCGMPKLELGDLKAVEAAKEFNVPRLAELVAAGYDLVAPVPSCVLMFKQDLPLLFAGDETVETVARHFYDPFEYLMLRHREGLLSTSFTQSLGRVAYHAPCHLRVQNIGLKTRDLLELVPDTEVSLVERCSGHDGTYAVKKEFHDVSMKIGRPVFRQMKAVEADHYTSDCPMAAAQIEAGMQATNAPKNPLTLLRLAYGLA